MFKQGLFLKIYLCFWLTTILVLTTQMVLDRLDDSGPFGRMKDMFGASLEMCGSALVAYYESGNHQAATTLSERYKTSHGIDTNLLDGNGKDLGGQPVDQSIAKLAGQAMRSGKTEHLHEGSVDVMAHTIIGSAGQQYVVLGKLDRKNLGPPPHGRASTLVLRLTIVLGLSGLVCYILTRYLVSPLNTLKDATKRFAAGELSVRIGKKFGRRKDETTELAHDFDAMAERIESLMKLQRQLIGDISHELRSPLARLNVALDLARRQTGVEAEHALNRIEEETLELNSMIGEVLTLTSLESGNESVNKSPMDMAKLVREIAEDGDFEAQGSNRDVTLLECDECMIIGNYELLKRAIENVVRNAINYTAENTNVEINLAKTQQQIEITVRDYGPGVPESELGNIFRPFYRVSESRQRQSGGSGLGLAIADRAVRLHKGTITANNEYGGGLVVTIKLDSMIQEQS